MIELKDWLSGCKEQVTVISSPPFLPELQSAMDALMKQHGGWIDMGVDCYLLHFPEGTIREEIYPRVLSSRYRITFPDGFQISEWVNWKGESLIRIPLEAFPPEIHQQTDHQ